MLRKSIPKSSLSGKPSRTSLKRNLPSEKNAPDMGERDVEEIDMEDMEEKDVVVQIDAVVQNIMVDQIVVVVPTVVMDKIVMVDREAERLNIRITYHVYIDSKHSISMLKEKEDMEFSGQLIAYTPTNSKRDAYILDILFEKGAMVLE